MVTVAPHRLSTAKKGTFFPSQRGSMCYSQRPCLPNSHIRCCLEFGEVRGFVWRELNAFGWLRQALVHIQTRHSLGRRPRRTLNHFGRCALYNRLFGHGYNSYKSFLVLLEHPAQESAD